MKQTIAVLGLCVGMAWPTTSHAFCGFYVSGADASLYNNATMVVMMREGTRTVLSMQNNYQGPPEDFAMIVPVPVVLQEENVKTLPREIFTRVDKLAAPRLVEYWEQDPCRQLVAYEASAGNAPMARRMKASAADESDARLGVTIEAEFTVAEYDIVVLSANDSGGLEKWLRKNEYNIPKGAKAVLRPYVAEVLAGLDLVDRHLYYDPRGKDSGQRGWRLLRTLRREKFDITLLLPNSFRSGWLAWLSGSKRRVGFNRDGRGRLLTDRVTPKPKSEPHPVIDEYLRLAETLGCDDLSRRMELAVLPDDQQQLDDFWKRHAPALRQTGMVCLNPGGAFGAVLRQTNVAGLIQDLPRTSPAMICTLAFLITAAIRTAQGSATVAMITAVGILSGLARGGDLGFHPVYLALAIGCGSKPIAWMNDSGFWVITRMSGMTETEGLKFVTPMTTLMGIVGLGAVIVGVTLFPMV